MNIRGTRQHPITDITPDGVTLQVVRCDQCGQLEVWAAWEIHDHGWCRNAAGTGPDPADCDACHDAGRQPCEPWWLLLQLIHGGDNRRSDISGMTIANLAAAIPAGPASVKRWLAGTAVPNLAAQASIERLYQKHRRSK